MINPDPYVRRFVPPVTTGVSGVLSDTTFAVKDLFCVAGQRTGNGNATRERDSGAARTNAHVIDLLLAAGATLTGITRMDELALSLNGINPYVGAEHNPAYPGRITGGSSSGSASVVAGGTVTFALGSDTGGSLRLPASFCGLFTLRPSYGRVDTSGMLPLAPSFDTPGVFTRNPELLSELMHLLLTGTTTPLKPKRVLIPTELLALCDPLVGDACHKYATRLAQQLDVPLVVEPVGIDVLAVKRAFLTLLGGEAYATHADLFVRAKETLSDATCAVLQNGSNLDSARRDTQLAVREQIGAQVNELLRDTLMVTPASPCLPPLVDAPHAELVAMNAAAVMLHGVGSLTGVPSVVVPQTTSAGTVGVMITGPKDTDETLLTYAKEVQ